MYNPEQKGRFLQQYTHVAKEINAITRCFNFIAPYEEKWGDDLCTMDASALRPAITGFLNSKIRTKWAALLAIKDYSNWAIDSGVPNAKCSISQIDIEPYVRMRDRSVLNPGHLQAYLDAVYDSEDSGTLDCVYRCFVWLAYMGVENKDTEQITSKCINLDYNFLTLNNRPYPIYPESVRAFKEAIELRNVLTTVSTTFRTGEQGTKVVFTKARAKGDKLLRLIRNKDVQFADMRNMWSKRSRKALRSGATTLALSYGTVKKSGIYYRFYQNERMGLPPAFASVIETLSEDKVFAVGNGFDRNTQINRLIRELRDDYALWKLAYDL